ncbi:His Kinase A (phospho-acceptor) domain-containing protein [Algoriphagus ornithinivorans]|uniref:histidine kinase n=1 Tax=Algoriphagus ornithinivorans TaxID=226506 RepID=A0A1I5AHV5_9BACT|nr:response regulator [Algoriphagus ornithinivorans]SFN62061.1 His Kinase A (phospho-acceptor) domain-containing protein [Algoriphagus ornithinivorans]
MKKDLRGFFSLPFNYQRIIFTGLGICFFLFFSLLSRAETFSEIQNFKRPAPRQSLDKKILNLPKNKQEQILQEIYELVISKQSNLAVSISGPILEEIKLGGQYKSEMGLKARLFHGAALIHADTSTATFDFLWNLKDDSREQENWVILAETNRIIASLLEFVDRPNQSFDNLNEARALIREHQLDSIYPNFAVRISSWHRIFGQRDSSIYFAKEAIRSGKLYDNYMKVAEGNLLLGLNFSNFDREQAIGYFLSGAKYYQLIGDFSGYSNMKMNVAKLQIKENRHQEALSILDSLLVSFPQRNENNIDHLSRVFLLKADAFENLGKKDSAIFYLRIGYESQLEEINSYNNEQIIEIDNKYNVEKQQRELEAQSAEIELEKTKRNLLIGGLIIVFCFVLLLLRFNLRLSAANKLNLEQAHKLQVQDEAKSQFYANISHELRTPLTLISGPINSLIKGDKSPDQKERLLMMAHQSSKDLQSLVNKILDFRKLEMGKITLKESATDIEWLFKSQAALFDSLALDKNINYSYESHLEYFPTILLDQEKFKQIFNNLLSNALKFTLSGGQIKASLLQEDNYLILEVSDSGIGIPKTELPFIFDRFYQVNSHPLSSQGGTGIGLHLVQSFLALMEGNIEVESPDPKTRKGTLFKVRFPIKESTTNPLNKEILEKSLLQTNTKNEQNGAMLIGDSANSKSILVVEDNPDLQEYLGLILSNRYIVHKAYNGQEAWDFVQNDPKINLIISDLMMPVMDGYELLGKLKSYRLTAPIPIIMLTARADKKDKLKALRIGVDDYLVKNFDEDELLIRVENLLKNQDSRLEVIKVENNGSPVTTQASEEDQTWLMEVEDYIKQNISSNLLTIPSIAEEFAMSESTFLRQLKKLIGLTPIQYIQEIRLNEARYLLENRIHNTVSKIAAETGYQDPAFFSRSFKKRFGKTPSDYLKY